MAAGGRSGADFCGFAEPAARAQVRRHAAAARRAGGPRKPGRAAGVARAGGDVMNRNASALLLALWLTMALALLVSVFAYAVNQEIEWTSWHRKKDEAGVLAKSALQYLPKLLEDQRKES